MSKYIGLLNYKLTHGTASTAYWVINDYPETAKFLTQEEKDEVHRRLKLDRAGLADEFNTKYFFHAIKDWKIYIHMLITIGIYTPLYSFSLFLPTIVAAMGHTNNTAQLMTVPPYVVACAATISGGILADKCKQRGIFMIFFCALSIIGFTMLLSSGKPTIQYIGTFFAATGIYPNVPMGVAWNGNNIGGSTKRGVGIAMHVGFGNLGGIITAFTYLSREKPRYRSGHSTLLGTISMSMCLCIFMTIYLRYENARRDKLLAEQGRTLADYNDADKEAGREKGDYASFFRYTI